jgi:hypothetical protein
LCLQDNSPAGAKDPLPGICALAERWLDSVALASFRAQPPPAAPPAPPPATLDRWFLHPDVAWQLPVSAAD